MYKEVESLSLWPLQPTSNKLLSIFFFFFFFCIIFPEIFRHPGQKMRTTRRRYVLTFSPDHIFQQNNLPPAATVYTKTSARYAEHFQFIDQRQLD